MRIYADVYDPTGVTRLGDGPIQITGASVTRALDGAGSFSCAAFGADSRAQALFAPRRRVRIFYEYENKTREIGRGVINDISLSGDAANLTIQVSGSDEIVALKDKSTLMARLYKSTNISVVIADMLALAGWTGTTTSTAAVSIRFDGESVLKGLQTLCDNNGLHFRQGTAPGTLEVDTFGIPNGIRFVHVEHSETPLYDNDNLVIIDNISLAKQGTDLVNWILPIGGGEGEAALTLQKSTRTSPYAIQTMTGPDGRTLYYISDATSIAAFGQIERIAALKDISPLSNSDADIVAAANALYDACATFLTRHKHPVETYSISGRKPSQTIRPGDLIRAVYKGVMFDDQGREIVYRDINTDLWVLESTESVSESGATISLQVSTVDRYEQEAAGIIIGALDAIQINNLKVQPYPSCRSYTWDREIAPGYPAQVPVRITDATLALQRIQIRIKTMPFRATASTAAASGDHTHVVFAPTLVATASQFITGYAQDQAGSLVGIGMYWTKGTPAPGDEIRTYQGSGNHTHPITFGITDDSQTPDHISVYVDGIDRTTALNGGVYAPAGGNQTIDLNIGMMTNWIANASGGLQQEHIIELRCTGGRGRVEAQVEIYDIIQAIKLA